MWAAQTGNVNSETNSGRQNQALEQTRDNVLRYGESVGCELLNFFVRRLTMKLAEVCHQLHDLPADGTIYARLPWSLDSDAIVATEPEGGGLPVEAAEQRLSYFIEVDLARDFLADWLSTQPAEVPEDAACKRLILYAENDA